MVEGLGFGDRHAVLASDARRRVLELIAGAREPVDATAVAASIGLHVTTARFHLDQLEGAGLIRRAVDRTGIRGRPRILFTVDPGAREDGVQRLLSHALVGALAEDDDGGRARAIRAGERWSAALDAEARESEPGGEATGGASDLRPLVRILDGLGFDPVARPVSQPVDPPVARAPAATAAPSQADARDGLVIELRACPFRDEARHTPAVVCSLHLGLIRGVARSGGHDPDDVELRPFVLPELCEVRLRGDWRPDAATPLAK
jgi:predicted ArsR family transcriptional regulator